MKIKSIETTQTIRKVAKFKKRPKKSRSARTKSSKRRRRRLKAALYRHARRTKPLGFTFFPESFCKGRTLVRQRSAVMSGNCYWLNYFNVFQWKDHHLTNKGATAYALPGQSHWSSDERLSSLVNAEKGCSNGLESTAGSSELLTAADVELTHEDFYDEDVAQDEESDEDIVVTEEMMQFLEISMRHKASLNIEKEEAKKQEETILYSERDATEDCQVPSDEANDEKRRTEMAFLYGEKAPMIHGMETAQQLTFNRQVDIFNPPYWPIHPFTIQFKST